MLTDKQIIAYHDAVEAGCMRPDTFATIMAKENVSVERVRRLLIKKLSIWMLKWLLAMAAVLLFAYFLRN